MCSHSVCWLALCPFIPRFDRRMGEGIGTQKLYVVVQEDAHDVRVLVTHPVNSPLRFCSVRCLFATWDVDSSAHGRYRIESAIDNRIDVPEIRLSSCLVESSLDGRAGDIEGVLSQPTPIVPCPIILILVTPTSISLHLLVEVLCGAAYHTQRTRSTGLFVSMHAMA